MKIKSAVVFLLVILMCAGQIAAAKRSTDEIPEVQKTSKVQKVIAQPAKEIVSGIVDVVKSPEALVSETVEETKSKPLVLGTVEGITQGTGKAVVKSVEGATKVATLGSVKKVEVQASEKSKNPSEPGEGKPTRFKIFSF